MMGDLWRAEVEQINARLKAAGLPVRVMLRGKAALTLQATLPLKLGAGRKQQEISLGVRASKAGLRRIENEAHLLARRIIDGSFRWSLYLDAPVVPLKNTGELVADFKAQYLASHQIKESTWREGWGRTLGLLPAGEPLSEAAILAVLLLTENHSRSRELASQRLTRLAEFAGVVIDLKPFQGEYGEKSLTPRDLPSDALILECRERISNPHWRWVFGMMAAYGLRPHECWFCEFVDARTVHILQGKTGFHVARPLLLDWAERWDLRQSEPPPVTGRTFRDYGQRTYRQFGRYEMPFNPYDLRHAYAIRGIVIGLPVQVMAGMMGHSVQVHTRTYCRWLTDAVAERVYLDIINRPNGQSNA